METKDALRKTMRRKRREMEPAQRRQWNAAIQGYVETDALWQNAATVLAYWSMEDEVDTHGLVSRALNANKTLLLPRCRKGCPTFDLVQISNPASQMESGPFPGLMQPLEDLPARPDLTDIDLILVPGLAFSQDGWRLGMGGGMYDRFFQTCRLAPRLALAYGFQILAGLPHEAHDEPVDWIVTETGRCENASNRRLPGASS